MGETIGPVVKTRDASELKGGKFMRVRVLVNILEPICRGRRVTFGQIQRGGFFFSSTNVFLTYVIGAIGLLMMIRSAQHGYRVRVL